MKTEPGILFLAAVGHSLLILVAAIVPVLIIAGMAVFALYLYRGFEALARRSLARRYADLQIHNPPLPGEVEFTYHTYHGLVAWFTETTHRVSLPPDQARVLLRRLLWFNFTWGLTSYGAIFIPLLALGNYFAQLHAISKQETAIALAPLLLVSANKDDLRNPYAPPLVYEQPAPPSNAAASIFHLALGTVCALLCLMFVVSTVVGVVRLDFEATLGCGFATALLGWTAWSYLEKR